ncbi:DNA repair protein RecN [Candidatus Gastranaerophilus sp. (ex Termes propinquus)]|nr:DNA repair protein RecN [Candidatus Gastranaerophilus sp. (ex Termes propinquus)]
MIKSLYIKNFILIDELALEFEKGLNVFTGETGAGKSIILKAVDVALGARTSKDMAKGDKNALIEIVFEKDGEETVVSKEISSSGSKSRLDGAFVNNDTIKELREGLIDIHSQHQTYAYIAPKYHIKLLDMYISKENKAYGALLEKCGNIFNDIKNTKEQLSRILENNSASERQVEFLRFQTGEIEDAALVEGEEEELKRELEVLSNIQTLKELCYGAFWTLSGEDGAVCDALSKVKYDVAKAASLDSSLKEIEEDFIQASEGVKECSNALRRYVDRLSDDPQRLDEAQSRLQAIEKLKRKYGDVFKTYSDLKEELEVLEGKSVSAQELEAKLSELNKTAREISEKLTCTRRAKGKELSGLIMAELEKLELLKSRFVIDIQEANFNALGCDSVEFLITTNISQEPAPVAKIASGGEISRVMLAIKTVFARCDKLNTIVFDEIDTGISGKTSQAVASALQKLAESCQILAITHQPIIAASANAHFLVSKTQGEATEVSVKKLDEIEHTEAIARLASGGVSEESVTFAKELIAVNQKARQCSLLG